VLRPSGGDPRGFVGGIAVALEDSLVRAFDVAFDHLDGLAAFAPFEDSEEIFVVLQPRLGEIAA
jgi:hypothetical protein